MTSKGFELALVPQLVRDEAMYTTGFLPNDSMNLYRVNPASPTDQELREEDDLWLIGTAEVPLVAQHSGEIFDADQLPLRYV
jgi:seryl-tRNA synthetase